ncbi:proton channel OTOP2-like [Clavelina lepadiformis]|uniref:proton channel OTOP2-like n=1 Tax=Clavelina lepadiformis TaxID=159417 RepID=UPI004042F72D
MNFSISKTQDVISIQAASETKITTESAALAKRKAQKQRCIQPKRFSESSADSSEVAKSEPQAADGIAIALSVLYGIIIVSLTFVFKVSDKIASETMKNYRQVAEYYLDCVLFISVSWLTAFKISSCGIFGRNTDKTQTRNASYINHWLIGVVCLFGIIIVVKSAFELVAVTQISDPCTDKVPYGILFVMDGLHVLLLADFIFLHRKNSLNKFPVQNRFATVHLLATSLSIWLNTVFDEITHALEAEDYQHPNVSSYAKTGGMMIGNCLCSTEYCEVVAKAELFLSPILVEFSFVVTCLLYIIWRKVGQSQSSHHSHGKPKYKISNTFKGILVGILVFLVTIAMIILLDFKDNQLKNSTNETAMFLSHTFEAFLIACNTVIIIACIAGFYIQFVHQRLSASSLPPNLDVVLFFTCLIGLIVVDLFVIFSLCAAPPADDELWALALVYPFMDMLANLLQAFFIMFGLQINVSKAKRRSKKQELASATVAYDNEVFIESVKVTEEKSSNCDNDNEKTRKTLGFTMKSMSTPDMLQYSANYDTTNATISPPVSSAFSDKDFDIENDMPAEIHNTPTPLRNIAIFLVFINTALWLFLSLNGLLFVVDSYQDTFYGHEAWAIITSVTKPLSVFLRMHAAACLFEMWYFR